MIDPNWIAVVITIFGAAVNYGVIKQALKNHDEKFAEIRDDQSDQWSKINTTEKELSELKGGLKCPLPGCPMTLTPHRAKN